jgi:organic radical activating enzyme
VKYIKTEIDNSVKVDGLSLPVMEDFYTIQGEGYFQGHAAYFIRLGGCDVGCHWCDVKESWDASKFPQILAKDLASKVANVAGKIVVITGGEPLMHNLTILTEELKNQGCKTHIETSGVYPVSGTWDWICFSPKKFKEPNFEIYNVADELKVIVYNKSDLEWAESHASKVKADCILYLQPEWSNEKQVLPLIIEYIKENPQWQISLQIHKYMNIP